MHAYVVEYIVDGGHERRFQRAMRSKQNQYYSMKQSHQRDNLLLNCDLLCTAQVVSAVNGPALLLQLNLVEAAKKAANPTLQFIPSEFSAFGAVGASLQLPDVLRLNSHGIFWREVILLIPAQDRFFQLIVWQCHISRGLVHCCRRGERAPAVWAQGAGAQGAGGQPHPLHLHRGLRPCLLLGQWAGRAGPAQQGAPGPNWPEQGFLLRQWPHQM